MPRPEDITRAEVEALLASTSDIFVRSDCANALRFWGGRASRAPLRRIADELERARTKP